MAPSWCLLPPEITDLFLQRLPFPDCLTFGKVCKSWRHVYLDRLHLTRPPPFMVRPGNCGCLCSLYGGQMLELRSPTINMPRPQRILGSSMGWLAIQGDSYRLHLLNPISKEQMFLPVFANEDLRWYYVDFHHVVLSAAPSSGDCIIVLRGRFDDCMISLAWCRLGDSKWNMFHVDWHLRGGYESDSDDDYEDEDEDMMFYNGKFYISDSQAYHIFSFCPMMKKIGSVSFSSISESRHWSDKKLVQSGSELLLVGVWRHKKSSGEFNSLYQDIPFDIFKLEEEPDKWVRAESLGKQALLLGYNRGTTVESFCTEDLMGSGLEANCVYFWRTDELVELMNFSLADGSTQRISNTLTGSCASSKVYWIVPQTWRHLNCLESFGNNPPTSKRIRKRTIEFSETRSLRPHQMPWIPRGMPWVPRPWIPRGMPRVPRAAPYQQNYNHQFNHFSNQLGHNASAPYCVPRIPYNSNLVKAAPALPLSQIAPTMIAPDYSSYHNCSVEHYESHLRDHLNREWRHRPSLPYSAPQYPVRATTRTLVSGSPDYTRYLPHLPHMTRNSENEWKVGRDQQNNSHRSSRMNIEWCHGAPIPYYEPTHAPAQYNLDPVRAATARTVLSASPNYRSYHPHLPHMTRNSENEWGVVRHQQNNNHTSSRMNIQWCLEAPVPYYGPTPVPTQYSRDPVREALMQPPQNDTNYYHR